jgi:hypothetical protein
MRTTATQISPAKPASSHAPAASFGREKAAENFLIFTKSF